MQEKELTLIDGLDENGKDREIKVIIKTMSAYKAEQWLIRAMLALGKGFDGNLSSVKKNHSNLIKAIAGLDYATAKPLLDELLLCCTFVKDGQSIKLSESTCEVIQSPVTLMKLRIESAKLNFGFFQGGGVLNSLFGDSIK